MINHLTKKCYFMVDSLILHQCTGTSMLTDQEPFLANVHPYDYDFIDFILILFPA